jgi:hypothetical protein
VAASAGMHDRSGTLREEPLQGDPEEQKDREEDVNEVQEADPE